MKGGQPPGGATFGSARWRSAPGTARRDQPRLYSQLRGKMVRVTLIVWGRRREVRSVSRFRSFFSQKKIVMKETEIIHSQIPPKLNIWILGSLKNPCLVIIMLSYCISHGEIMLFFYSIIVSLTLIPCFLFSRYPLFQSFSPPTATFTFRKKNSSNQVTSLFLILVVVVGNV